MARLDEEPYFRVKHDLKDQTRPALPEGFALRDASPEEYAALIRLCYATAADAEAYRRHAVYCPGLWVAVEDVSTGEIVATGIAEMDSDVGEGVLERIQVSENYRGRGPGAFAVYELLWRRRGKTRFATVSGQVNNPTCPEALYRKCGLAGTDVWHVLWKK